MAATEFEIPSGTLIDQRYRIRRVLGRGGFGRTYLAADERRFNELCVLKEFVPKTNGDSVVDHKLQELFMREASILHKLDHPQIPKFFASFEQNNRLFIAQEYVDGKTYWRVLQDRQRFGLAFTEFEVLQFLRDLLRVLHYIHQKKIVHRDISPDNVMLPKGRDLPVLIDFGVVKQAVTYIHGIPMGSNDVIQASVSVGKFGYAPYEQIRMGQCSSSSDIYALGVTAIVLLTGKAPNLLVDPKSLDWRWRSYVRVDDSFAAILNRMMAEKPQDRYSSALEVLGDLEKLGQCIGIRASRVILPATGMMLNGASQPHQNTDLLAWPTHVESVRQTTLPQCTSTLKQRQTVSQTMPRLTGMVPTTQIHQSQLRARAAKRSPVLWTRKPIWQLVSLCGLALLPVGGALVGVRSPYIPALCQQLNNCVEDQDSKGRYQQAIEQADAALISVQNATSVMDLQRAHDRLADAIAQMLSITSDVSVFAQAQQDVQQYQTRFSELETRLEREIRAVDLLSRAETLAQSAAEQIKIAKTPADFASVQMQWRKAIATLQSIPNGTFVAAQTAQSIQTYLAQIEELNPKVASRPRNPSVDSELNTTVRMVAPNTPQPTATQTPQANRESQKLVQSSPQASARPQTSPTRIPLAPSTPDQQSPSPSTAIASAPAAVRPASPRPSLAPLTANVINPSPERSPIMMSQQTTLPVEAGQTVNDVSIRIEGAQLSSTGTLIANFTVENSSNRVFGFVPVFTEVRDANQQPIRSRMMIGSENAMIPPGGRLEGQMFIFDRNWNASNHQSLRLLISEGTTGNRAFDIVF